jgi:hypothetical protein
MLPVVHGFASNSLPSIVKTDSPNESASLAALCARPFVRRLYQALVVALAVFLVILVGLKQPFRGYLAESRLLGPATEGLDLEAAAAWIKAVDRQVAAVANPPRAELNRGQLRITFVGNRASMAAARVDQLAQRWLYQYLPDRLQAYRQAALVELRAATASARQREDAAHEELEMLRQKQLAGIRHNVEQIAALASSWIPAQSAALLVDPGAADARSKKLAEMREQLGLLADQCTDEHPHVRTLRSQITALEQQLAAAAEATTRETTQAGASQRNGKGHFVSTTSPATLAETPREASSLSDDLAKAVSTALADLSRATASRQEAENRLAERMHELSSRASGVQWAKSSPTVSRLGGTPRCSTLLLASFLACMSGVWVFRAAAADGCSAKLHTAADLASAVELPIVANLAGIASKHKQRLPWLLTPARLKWLVQAGEGVLCVAVGACLLSIAIDPTLAPQVLADPFGTLSEVLGRFGV